MRSRIRDWTNAMWTSAKAPSLAEMEAMAHDIFERLPATFASYARAW
jgi:predicted Zn-dependent protease with MMP-like domain